MKGFPLLVLLVACLVLCCFADEETPVRGVNPQDLHFYQPTSVGGKPFFECLDKSTKIPFEQVNDDYCDCQDGSDEPGTNACSNSKFYCANYPFVSKQIYSSRVNDGICDCCDGSDEFDSPTTCQNNCEELKREGNRETNEKIQVFKEALETRQQHIRTAAQQLEEKRNELQTLREQLETKKQEQSSAQAEKEKQEKLEELEKQKRELEEKEMKEKQEQQNTEDAASKEEAPADAPTAEVEQEKPEPYVSEEADQAREKYSKITGEVEALQSQVSSLEKLLQLDFGKENEFYYLKGRCFETRVGEYVYKLCPFENAHQNSIHLGNFERWEGDYQVMKFSGGVVCWQGPARSMTVSLHCGKSEEARNVQEPNKCTYTMDFYTPSACTPQELERLIGSVQ